MFKGRTLPIATKHEKEKVIAPILEKEIGVRCVVSSKFDTDSFGTFTGEIERENDPIITLVAILETLCTAYSRLFSRRCT